MQGYEHYLYFVYFLRYLQKDSSKIDLSRISHLTLGAARAPLEEQAHARRPAMSEATKRVSPVWDGSTLLPRLPFSQAAPAGFS